MIWKPPELDRAWEEYQTRRQASYVKAMKRYGPHAHWFAQRYVSQVRAMRRVLLNGGHPFHREFSSNLVLHVWREKRQTAIEAKHRKSIRSLPYKEQTRRMSRLLKKLQVL